jgi:hypothetical protein
MQKVSIPILCIVYFLTSSVLSLPKRESKKSTPEKSTKSSTRMSPTKAQTPKELQEYGKQDNETDIEWAQRVSELYDPTQYRSKIHCDSKKGVELENQLCYCLLPEQFGLKEDGQRYSLSGSHMRFSDLSSVSKDHTTTGNYNCTEQLNLCHHTLHYDSIFTDGPVMLEELVGGGLMTKLEMEQCFMRSFYYGMRQREMSLQYQKHLIGVHAHYDLAIYEKDGYNEIITDV